MKLATKLTLFLTFLICIASGLLCYNISTQVAEDMSSQYKKNFEAVAETISNDIVQMELMTASVLRNTLLLFRKEIESRSSEPTTSELIQLRDHYEVSNLYLINNEGHFYKVTNDLLNNNKPTPWSIFQSNPEYKVMLQNKEHIEITPFLWLRRYDTPAKFAMMSAKDGSKIIEVGINTDLTSGILKHILKAYPAINSMSIETPTGQKIGQLLNEKTFGSNGFNLSKRVEAGIKDCKECAIKEFTKEANDYHYILKLNVSSAPLISSVGNAQLKVFTIFTLITLAIILLVAFFVRKFMHKLSVVHDGIKETIATGNFGTKVDDSGNDEVAELAKSFNLMMQKLDDSQSKLVETEKLKIFHKTASQVAHDIRSPLTLLNLALQNTKELPEQERGMIRNAVNKISDILFNIVPKKQFEEANENKKQKIMLSALIEEIVAEKRYEYNHKQNININFNCDFNSYGVFLDLEVIDLKRTLSNIINNSVEAIATNISGEINIYIEKGSYGVKIVVSDNGKGISKENINKVLDEGFTAGKENGTGKGLAFSKQFTGSNNGKLEVQSVLNKGTDISITLPISKTPSWYLNNIAVNSSMNIVIVDDDYSIHQLWDKRFSEISKDIKVVHHYNKDSLNNWLKNNGIKDSIFLVDFEFVGESYNGVGIIKEFGLSDKSILVTSRFEDIDVLKLVKGNQLPMIPKSTAINVPIDVVFEVQGENIVLLDDDANLAKNLKRFFEKKCQVVNTYNSSSQLFHELWRYSDNTKFLIDLNIHGDKDGVQVCEELSNKKYSHINLFTGDSEFSIANYGFISQVITKGSKEGLSYF